MTGPCKKPVRTSHYIHVIQPQIQTRRRPREKSKFSRLESRGLQNSHMKSKRKAHRVGTWKNPRIKSARTSPYII